nr:sugar phosphate isomerase/epimerase [Sphingomonas vulcanisoli]
MTATDLDACQLADEAAKQGCQAISTFTHVPAVLPADFPRVSDQASVRALRSRMTAGNLTLLNAEYFPLTTGVCLEDYRPGLSRAAGLGARQATTHVQIEDAAAQRDAFKAFSDLCAEYGLLLALEFTSTAKIKSLKDALHLIETAGEGNAVLTLDLLHAARTGVTVEQIAAIDGSLLGTVQICDGPAHMAPDQLRVESLTNRLPPGSGDLPLVAMLRSVPKGTPIEVEVPQHPAMKSNVSAHERIRQAIRGAKSVLERSLISPIGEGFAPS